jgi:hypothetical protein
MTELSYGCGPMRIIKLQCYKSLVLFDAIETNESREIFGMEIGLVWCAREELFQGDCTLERNYGYKEGKPCILLKLNRIYGWKPEPYNLR